MCLNRQGVGIHRAKTQIGCQMGNIQCPITQGNGLQRCQIRKVLLYCVCLFGREPSAGLIEWMTWDQSGCVLPIS